MNKPAILKKIIQQLRQELALYDKAARAAHAEATHEQSKAENKYDTRGLEASYLARGQSRQAAEIVQSIEQFEQLPMKEFAKDDVIETGALVELDQKGEKNFYFIGPRAGGTEITHDRREILVVTPQSPLGQQLVGKKQNDKWLAELAGRRRQYRIVSVW
ncbi:MAG: transcription elongation factor GreAB [Verrucomicrobiota bacterium]